MECWWVQPLSYNRCVHTREVSLRIRGMHLMAAGWDFAETKALLGIWGDADVQIQHDRIVRNKAIY